MYSDIYDPKIEDLTNTALKFFFLTCRRTLVVFDTIIREP